MALNLSAPEYSFVKFYDEFYGTFNPLQVVFNLPVAEAEDIAFQFTIETDTKDQLDEFFKNSATISFSIVDTNLNVLTNIVEKPSLFRLSDTILLANWEHGIVGLETYVQMKQCFRLRITVNHSAGNIVEYTNTFQRIKSDRFTSVLSFGSSNDSFGFNYCAGSSTPESTGGRISKENGETILLENGGEILTENNK